MLEGYKTYIGGIGFILMGIGSALVQYYNGDQINYETNLGLIVTGWTILGFRKAIKKI